MSKMSRLTTRMSIMGRKHDIERGQAHHWKKLLKDYDYQLIEEAVDKLGDLEDIEDELGIELTTISKLLKQGFVYIRDGALIEKNHGFIIDNTGLWSQVKLDPKEYGKTWALTKEELEK